jgi:hypothetical protein
MVTPKGIMSTEGESPNFCHTLQVLGMSTLGDMADVNPVIKFHSGIGGMYVPPYATWFIGSWRQSLLSTARCCDVCGSNLITGLTSVAPPRVNISSIWNVGQKLGASLPLLICSPSSCPSRLLYRRGRKSRRDLLIALYYIVRQLWYCDHTRNNPVSFVLAWVESTKNFLIKNLRSEYRISLYW